MNILTLDLATNTGWCLRENGRVESGVQVFDVKRGESPGMRYIRFRRWLWEIGPRADLIIYEQTVSSPGRKAVEIADGFATRAQEYCAERGIEHATVHAGTLKKWITGKGNSKKPAMREHALERGFIPPTITDDNEVDARCLLHYALAEIL